MILDPSCATSTRGPTVRAARGVLGGLLLAGLLTACGTSGAAGESATEAGGNRSAAASAEADSGAGKDGTEKSTGKEAAAARDDAGAVELETPLEVMASELPSAKPVAADAPQIQPISAVFEVHESFVPSDPPAAENPHASDGEPESAELDPAAVAAAEESAGGDALQETLASLTEFEHQGWEQRGVPVVVGKPVVAPLTAEGAEAARVTVCLDSSRVTVVDRAGNVVRGPEPERRALHNYDLVRPPGQPWQVVQHGFPDDPTC